MNAHTQNMFSHDIKRMSCRCQTLKFYCLNEKFFLNFTMLDPAQREDVFNQQEKKKLSERHPTFKQFAESDEITCAGFFFFRSLGKDYASANVRFQKLLCSTT